MSKCAYARKAVLAPLAAFAFIGAGMGDLSAEPATAAASLDALAGTWRGSGAMLFEDGTSENISCNGYYRPSPNLSVVFR